MLKFLFFGFCNFFFKFEKNNHQFSIGMKNIYFFLFLLKKYFKFSSINMSFKFQKKYSKTFMLLKSPNKYKISKHILSSSKHYFKLEIIGYFVELPCIVNFFKLYFLIFNFKKISIFSIPLLTITQIKILLFFDNDLDAFLI